MQTGFKKSIFTRIIKLSVMVAIILVGFNLYTNIDAVYDWWRLRGYEPSASIVKLASDTTMTSKAKSLFYVTHPQIEDKEQFNQNCPAQEHTIILGCYISGEERIYIYNVSDSRLDGVKQVTAAHEMLHVAYARLDKNQRNSIDDLLEAEITKRSHDNHLAELTRLYNKQEPGQLLNEMHSILGTEYTNLDSELEQHYSRYFTSRHKVVSYADKYRQVFDSMKVQIARNEARLRDLSSQISSLKTEIDSLRASLNQRKSQLDSLRSTDPEQYNSLVPGYNDLVNTYNAKIAQLDKLISDYNNLVNEHNNIAIEYNNLNHELDSNYRPIE